MNMFVINYDPFAMESRVMMKEDDIIQQVDVASNIDELAEFLVEGAYAQGIYSVKVKAPFAITNEIKRAVAEKENKVYSENKIKVEGI